MDNSPLPEDKDATLVDPHHARFQRTDQWMPVYSWLESLDTDEVVKSKDILDWLSENPEIKEQLYSRHSRYHLMHYIKKCHVKILKRKEKKKGLQPSNKANYAQVHKTGATKLPVPVPWFLEFLSVVCNKLPELEMSLCPEIYYYTICTMNNLPIDSDIYVAKRSEAFRKYEILIELEKQLSTVFPKPENVNNLKES
ncbi:uncharacterized protein LOC114267992 isoform X1 [Camellia sinensis]|uniref:uncharacterized protein LOC114267992 isoform X1 n=1 Tax=Camellia sinensis TaxID=4442 RepID=UPI001036A0B3|nr:uncharacterized protein LOC114267992 isoform X1 [Camellia sinensis]